MAYVGTGAIGDVYTQVAAAEQGWKAPTGGSGGCADAVSASVATGVTRTIPTECDIVVVGRFNLYGTGALVLQGDAQLKVL